MNGRRALCLLLGLGLAQPAAALWQEVPRSGQDSPVAPFDDGDLRPGRPWPSPRFVHHGDGTLSDRLSGLTWIHDAYCAHESGYLSGAVTPDPALADAWPAWLNPRLGRIPTCRGYAAAGRDWRLPTLADLLSLHQSAAPGALWLSQRGSAGFIDVGLVAGALWSATPAPGGRRWVVDLDRGGSRPLAPGEAPAALPPLVRGPEETRTPPDLRPRFLDDDLGRAHDRLTGLVWLTDPDCLGGQGDWHERLARVQTLADDPACPPPPDGLGPWRLPSINELLSLQEPARSPALPADAPLALPAGEDPVLWSATADPADPGGRARAYHPASGAVEGGRPLDQAAHAWAVAGPDRRPDLQLEPAAPRLSPDRPLRLTLHALALPQAPLRIHAVRTRGPVRLEAEDCSGRQWTSGERCTLTLRPQAGADGTATLELEANTAAGLHGWPLALPAPADEGGSGCLIAALLSGPAAPARLARLRRWRDRSLAPHPWGRRLIRAYYAAGARLLPRLRRHPRLLARLRLLLRSMLG